MAEFYGAEEENSPATAAGNNLRPADCVWEWVGGGDGGVSISGWRSVHVGCSRGVGDTWWNRGRWMWRGFWASSWGRFWKMTEFWDPQQSLRGPRRWSWSRDLDNGNGRGAYSLKGGG